MTSQNENNLAVFSPGRLQSGYWTPQLLAVLSSGTGRVWSPSWQVETKQSFPPFSFSFFSFSLSFDKQQQHHQLVSATATPARSSRITHLPDPYFQLLHTSISHSLAAVCCCYVSSARSPPRRPPVFCMSCPNSHIAINPRRHITDFITLR